MNRTFIRIESDRLRACAMALRAAERLTVPRLALRLGLSVNLCTEWLNGATLPAAIATGVRLKLGDQAGAP